MCDIYQNSLCQGHTHYTLSYIITLKLLLSINMMDLLASSPY